MAIPPAVSTFVSCTHEAGAGQVDLRETASNGLASNAVVQPEVAGPVVGPGYLVAEVPAVVLDVEPLAADPVSLVAAVGASTHVPPSTTRAMPLDG